LAGKSLRKDGKGIYRGLAKMTKGVGTVVITSFQINGWMIISMIILRGLRSFGKENTFD
jgi:hypothetical protein